MKQYYRSKIQDITDLKKATGPDGIPTDVNPSQIKCGNKSTHSFHFILVTH